MKITSITVDDFVDDGAAKRLLDFVVADNAVNSAAVKMEEKDEETKPSRRRASRKAADADATKETPDADGGGETKRRRPRRTGKAADKAEASSGSKPHRRSRAEARADKVEAEAGPEPENEDITDKELQQASSKAARRVGPNTVKEILGEFSVASVEKLDGNEARKEFIAQLEAAE